MRYSNRLEYHGFMDWSKAVRAAAKRKGITLEQLRLESGLANGTFYNVVAGRPPRVMRTIEKLRDAGVRIPRSFFTKSAA